MSGSSDEGAAWSCEQCSRPTSGAHTPFSQLHSYHCACRFKHLNAEDMLVYQCIQAAGNMGKGWSARGYRLLPATGRAGTDGPLPQVATCRRHKEV